MATDIRGLYENNRRREAHAVTATLPFVLESADLREGTAQVVALTGETYTALSIPDGVIVTGVSLVVETGSEYTTGDFSATIGGTNVFTTGLNNLATAGITSGTGVPLLVENSADLVITLAGTVAGTEDSIAKFVVEFTDYDRATMSYIGEE